MAEKKYYWLKLKDNFFDDVRLKKLRKIAGGDCYTIIYLKLLLLSIHNGGEIKFENVGQSLEEELALRIDEEQSNVAVTLQFLSNMGLLQSSDEVSYFLPYAVENTGSELGAAERMRRYRERKSEIESNSNSVTEASLPRNNVTLELRDKEIKNISPLTPPPKKEGETTEEALKDAPHIPTEREVFEYIKENGINANPLKFIEYNEGYGWKQLKKMTWQDLLVKYASRELSVDASASYKRHHPELNYNQRNSDYDSMFAEYDKTHTTKQAEKLAKDEVLINELFEGALSWTTQPATDKEGNQYNDENGNPITWEQLSEYENEAGGEHGFLVIRDGVPHKK